MQKLSKVDQLVISAVGASQFGRRLPMWVVYLLTVLLVFGSGYIRFLHNGGGPAVPMIHFMPVVLFTALCFDRYAGVFASVLGMLVGCAKPFKDNPGMYEIRIEGPNPFLFLICGIVAAVIIESLNHLYDSYRERSTELEKADARNKILITDINHRVKNHLTVLAGLLNLSKRKVQGEECKDALSTAASRLSVLARVYDRLHLDQKDADVRVDARGFIEQLCDDLTHSIIGERPIEIRYDVVHIDINTAKAVPIGLLVNEIITNAVKHAFNEDGGVIYVNFHPEGDEHVLTISDNGKGGGSEGQGTGTRLIASLAHQLKGTVETTVCGPNGGRRVIARFPRIPIPA